MQITNLSEAGQVVGTGKFNGRVILDVADGKEIFSAPDFLELDYIEAVETGGVGSTTGERIFAHGKEWLWASPNGYWTWVSLAQ